MTVAALRRLLEEIDTQGGPDAARHNRLHLPDEEGHEPVAQPVPQLASIPEPTVKTAAEAPALPVSQLLKWGDEHDDAEVRDQAARARQALRYPPADKLSRIYAEAVPTGRGAYRTAGTAPISPAQQQANRERLLAALRDEAA